MIYSFLFMFMMAGLLQPENHEPIKPAESDSVKSNVMLGMGDLFWQTGVHYSALDRMSFRTNSGLYGFTGPQPGFMLNDIPFDPSFFGVSFSQLIPEPFFRIENLDYHEGFGAYRGVGYSSGLIHLQSESIKRGISVFATGQYGHNKGEPGPWVFDPDKVSPNVERFGPWADAGLSVKFGGWYAKGLIRTHTNKNMDVFVQTRMSNLRGNAPENVFYPVDSHTVLHLAETGFENRLIDLRLQAIQSTSDDYLYFQPLAREVPSQLETGQYSALTNLYFTENLGLRTLFQYSEKTIGLRRNRFMHDFAWHETVQSARASFFYEGDRSSTDIGIHHKRSEATADGLRDGKLFLTTLHLEQHVQLHNAVRLGTSNLVSLRENQMVYQASGSLKLLITNRWSTEFKGEYSELFPEIANPTDFWVDRGYSIFDQLDIPFLLPETFANHRKTSISNSNNFQLSGSFSMDLSLLWINHISMNIPFQQAQYNLPYSTSPGVYTLHNDQSGQRYRAGFGIQHRSSPKFGQSFKAWINRTIDGDGTYKNYWKTIPEYVIHYSASFTPYPDIELGLRAQYRSATEWAEFEELDGEMNRTFHVQYPFSVFHFSKELPEHVNVNLSTSKWFWEQRIRVVVILKNLFNANYQTHPLGTRENFGYLARVEIRL